jgi:hypothetical protein
MKLVRTIVFAAFSLFAVPVFSAHSTGLNFGPEFASTRLDFDDSDYSKTHTTFGGLVGWQFNQVVGVEIGHYGGGRISESRMVDGATVNLDLKYKTTMVTIVGQHQFNDRYSVFARIGASTTKQDSTGSVGSQSWILNGASSSAIYGAGFGVSLERARIRMEYRRTKISFADSGALSLSLAWFVSKSR